MELAVEVGISATLGIRGLVATRDIAAGEEIERCPVILIPVTQEDALEATVLGNYYFLWDADFYAMALGYGSLHNHSYHANTVFKRDFEGQMMIFTAAKVIRRGEEVTINYNGETDDATPIHEGFGVG